MQLHLFTEEQLPTAETEEEYVYSLPLPEELMILGKRFQLVQVPEGVYSEQLGDDADGLAELDKQRITVRTHLMAEDYDKDTVFHEVIHATEQILHCRMKESQVHLLASGLLAVFSQNPEFATWLLT